MLCDSWYNLILPFLPLKFRELGLQEVLYGYIFGIYALTATFGSLFMGKLMTVWSRKAILIVGVILMGICMLLFSTIGYVADHALLLLYWLAIRAIQGLSYSMVQTTWFSIASICFPEEKQKYVGIVEASSGLGLISGPAIGAILFALSNFETTFVSVGVWLIILSVSLIIFIPSSVDIKDAELNDKWTEGLVIENSSINTSIKNSIAYTSLFTDYTFSLFAFVAFIAYFNFCYMEPVLAVRFSDFGLTPMQIGFFFCLRDAGYTSSLFLMSFYLTEKLNINREVMAIGLLVTGISQFLLGPAMFLPNNLVLMMFGQFLMSFGSGIYFIPILPEMIKAAVRKYPKQQIEASDISSGVLNFMLWMGQMISPVFGSYTVKYLGFRTWSSMVGYGVIIFWIVFYFSTRKPKGEIELSKDAFVELEQSSDYL